MTDLLTDGLRVLAHACPGRSLCIEVREDGRVWIYIESSAARWERDVVLDAHLKPGHALPTPGEALVEWRAGR